MRDYHRDGFEIVSLWCAASFSLPPPSLHPPTHISKQSDAISCPFQMRLKLPAIKCATNIRISNLTQSSLCQEALQARGVEIM